MLILKSWLSILLLTNNKIYCFTTFLSELSRCILPSVPVFYLASYWSLDLMNANAVIYKKVYFCLKCLLSIYHFLPFLQQSPCHWISSLHIHICFDLMISRITYQDNRPWRIDSFVSGGVLYYVFTVKCSWFRQLFSVKIMSVVSNISWCAIYSR